MSDIITKIFEMSILGSIVILITLLSRLLLKKKSKSLIMILWVAVALRLLCPISIESSLSIFNLVPQRTSANETTKDIVLAPAIKEELPTINQIPSIDTEVVENTSPIIVSPEKPTEFVPPVTLDTKDTKSNQVDYKLVLFYIWLAGVLSFFGYVIYSYTRLKAKLRDAIKLEPDVFESDKIPTPFVFGIVKPKIYIPFGLGEKERLLILTHERIHIKKGDYLSKIIAMICVCIHWFNPIVWFAFKRFEQDTEMRCDEEVLKSLGPDIREEYSLSLVSFAMRNKDTKYVVLPLSFSKTRFNQKEVTIRVKNLITYRKSSKLVAATIALALCVISTACSLNAKSDTKPSEVNESETTLVETSVTSEESIVETTSENLIVEEPGTTSEPVDVAELIAKDIEVIKEYKETHPDQEFYIGWDYHGAPLKDLIVFLIYTPDENNKVTTTTLDPFTFTYYENPEEPFVETIYGSEDEDTIVMVSNASTFKSANTYEYLDASYLPAEDNWIYNISPSYTYEEFMNISLEDLVITPDSFIKISVPRVDTLSDGIYFGYIFTNDSDYETVDLSVGTILSASLRSYFTACNNVSVTLPVADDCICYDRRFLTPTGTEVPVSFESSEFVESGKIATSAFIKVSNGQIVAIDSIEFI